MVGDNEPSPESSAAHDTAALLKRALDAVEKGQRRHVLGITGIVVLSLATVASPWCAYQAARWGRVQTIHQGTSNRAGRESSENTIAALQKKTFDALMFVKYVDAKIEGNKELEEFLYQRFRPETKKALEAWLDTDPFNNPNAPSAPFVMAEYVQPETVAAENQNVLADAVRAEAVEAGRTADSYVLLTVVLASVLFFGGLGGTLTGRRPRTGAAVIAVALLVGAAITLALLPICSEHVLR